VASCWRPVAERRLIHPGGAEGESAIQGLDSAALERVGVHLFSPSTWSGDRIVLVQPLGLTERNCLCFGIYLQLVAF